MESYQQTLDFFETLVNHERKGFSGGDAVIGLENVRDALKKIGDPERDYKIIHIAGTKGKGSTSVFCASILREASSNVGLYTSPHLHSVRERIEFNGVKISPRDLASTVSGIRERIGRTLEKRLTYFEFLTITAMKYFSDRKADAAVFETGLGGRLDATNTLVSDVCVITPISRDHMDFLGNDLEKIASEKAAIIKKGSVCICSGQNSRPLRVIRKRCTENRVRFIYLGKDISIKDKKFSSCGSVFDLVTPDTSYSRCGTRMPGEFQPDNAALAVCACEELWKLSHDSAIGKTAVKKGVRKAFLPARIEVLSKKPLLVVDGAHNEFSVMKLGESIRKIFKYDRVISIVGYCTDKDIKKMSAFIDGLSDVVIVTRLDTPRSEDPFRVSGYFKEARSYVVDSAEKALKKAFSIAHERDMILSTGSLYLAGGIRKAALKHIRSQR